MWRDTRDAILDMQQACVEVLGFAEGVTPEEIGKDLLRLPAIERSLSSDGA